MSSSPGRQTRRKFLKQLGIGLGAGLVSPLLLPASKYASALNAGSGRRLHLVNIVGFGGWDSGWFHNAMSLAEMNVSNNSEYSLSRNRFGCLSVPGKVDYYVKQEDSDGISVNSRNGNRSHFYGSGFRSLFGSPGDSTSSTRSPLLDKMLVWKGLTGDIFHNVGNKIMQNGMSSPYAIGFSGLVADKLASQQVRSLHYVALAEAPGDLGLNFAMNKGYAAPICINPVPNYDPNLTLPALRQMTTVGGYDVQNRERRSFLMDAVNQLSNSLYTSQLKNKNSVINAQAYASSLERSNYVASLNLCESVELKYLIKSYMIGGMKLLIEFIRAGNHHQNGLDNRLGIAARCDGLMPGFAAAARKVVSDNAIFDSVSSNMAIYRQAKSALADAKLRGETTTVLESNLIACRNAVLSGLNQISFNDGDPLQMFTGTTRNASMLETATKFALAEFLISENHSAVVDLSVYMSKDCHTDEFASTIGMFFTYACFKQLMQGLDSVRLTRVEAGGQNDTSLLDSTLIVMHTEMDRWHSWMAFNADTLDYYNRFPSAGGGVGSEHGSTTSIVMAGYGINGGCIVGDIYKGGASAERFAGISTIGEALPVNPVTGNPDPGGKKLSIKSLHPTICEIFNASVPAQQQSEDVAVPAIIKSSRVA